MRASSKRLSLCVALLHIAFPLQLLANSPLLALLYSPHHDIWNQRAARISLRRPAPELGLDVGWLRAGRRRRGGAFDGSACIEA